MITIKFPDGNQKEYELNITIYDIAKSISPSLAKIAIAGYIDGVLYDLNRPIIQDASLKIITTKDEEAFAILNHSTAHLLAAAVKKLFPKTIFGVGPSIEEGFYYDVNTQGEKISEEDLVKIEKEMNNIVASALDFERSVISKTAALDIFKGDKYKLELIEEIPASEDITIYQLGSFKDLCRGVHVGNVKNIKFFKLLSIAGAYWRGDANNEQLQRIYGTSWFTKDALEEHLAVIERRKERDHRKLGKELEIFEISPEYGQGLAIWLPKGYAIRKVLENYVYNLERKNGYEHVSTPVIGSRKLYETSGHWSHYKDNMFPVMERANEEFVMRPMSCPHHMLVYKTKMRSYRDLPIRYSETVIQHRYEASGALTGLERVRGMTLTDAHLFVREDQIEEEVTRAYNLVQTAISDLGLAIDYVELALRDKEKGKYHDDDNLWNQAENKLRNILNKIGVKYIEKTGEAAFYGPKIDIQVRTAMNKIITMSTVQLDFLLPIRFNLEYVGAGGTKEVPVVIHRGLISTYERLISILLEQYNGAFPLWLAPKQVDIIPVSIDVHSEFAKKLHDELEDDDFRTNLDLREETLAYKIRESQTNKVPYQVVIGDNEIKNNTITYRRFGHNEQISVSVKEFIDMLVEERKLKSRRN